MIKYFKRWDSHTQVCSPFECVCVCVNDKVWAFSFPELGKFTIWKFNFYPPSVVKNADLALNGK